MTLRARIRKIPCSAQSSPRQPPVRPELVVAAVVFQVGGSSLIRSTGRQPAGHRSGYQTTCVRAGQPAGDGVRISACTSAQAGRRRSASSTCWPHASCSPASSSTTPVAGSRALSELCAGPVRFKCENLQRTGSFKIRGAYTRIARLDTAQRAHGVVAASAGNHAQGVALAAQMLGITATVFMPAQAALPKVAATRGYGADVHLVGETVDDAIAAANAFAARTGAVLVHPFDHPDVIAGQGTVGLELLEQVPDVRSVLVGTGGGGLLGGVAAAVKGLRPDVEVIGVQAAEAACWPASLAAGGPLPLAGMRTVADGIAVGRPGDVTFEQVAALVDES